MISPLRSIVEDQVKYSRSLGIQAAYLGESNTKDPEILNGLGVFSLLYGSLESLIGDKKFRAMFSKEFYQKNPVAGTYRCSLVSMLICLLVRVLH